MTVTAVKTVKLTDKFRKDEIEWRVQSSGIKQDGTAWAKVLPYVTSRAIMNRLDETFKPNGWRDEYTQFKNGIVCTIYLKVGEDWIGKQDGAPETDIEAFKGGLSDAFKRAAVKWGMGRYLYSMKGPFFVTLSADKSGANTAVVKAKDGTKKYFTWNAPDVPGMYVE